MAHVNPEPAPVPAAGQPVTIWTRSFWIGLAERVIATFLMAFIAVISKTSIELASGNEFDITRVDWSSALLVAVGAAFLSLLKGILANLKTGDGPGLTHAEQTVPSLPNVAAA